MAQAYPWTRLYNQADLLTTIGESYYALPADFSYYHYDTFWDSAKHWRMYGPLTPQEYGDIQGYGLTAAPYTQFQIRGNAAKRIYLYPAPQDAQPFIFQYISNRCVAPITWETGLTITAGKYVVNSVGQYFKASTSGTTGAIQPFGTGPSYFDGGVDWAGYSGPYSTFLSDTDSPVISQRVFEQGLLERFADQKQISYQPRYLQQLDDEFAKDSPGSVFYAGNQCRGYTLQARDGTALFGRTLG